MGKLLSALLFAFGLSSQVAVAAPEATSQTVRADDGTVYSTGLLRQRPQATGVVHFTPAPVFGLPDAYDSKADGFAGPIRNQGSCGSCWAFAMTRTFEFNLAAAGLGVQDLAEQDWVTNADQHYGCNGGFMDADFAVDEGVQKEADCPYRARNGVRCNVGAKTKALRWGFVGAEGRAPTIEELKAAIYQYKALAVTVAAGSGLSNASDSGAVTRCSDRSINHMVTLTGWTADGKLIMDNSWGTSYGDDGRAYLAQGCNKLASTVDSALYIVAADGPGPLPPAIRLPREVTINRGAELMLGVRAEVGVNYSWSNGQTGPMIYVSPTADTTYTLTASNASGQAVSSVIVHVVE